MSLQKITEYYVRKPLTGQEIEKLTGTYPIPYSDLTKYKSLEQLLKKTGKSYAIVLYQTSSYSDGHYNCIGVNFQGNPFEFDPYGYTEEKIKQYTPYDEKLPDLITPLLEDYAERHNKKIVINTIDFQKKSGDVADCGRHASLAAIFSSSMTFENMHELYFTNQDPFLKGDNVATILTLIGLHDIGKWYREQPR